jgi:4-amino-4-deoxy-L-arabinose transferase-like glycosyltransferase
VPGGALERALLARRGSPIPATGSAWSSLPRGALVVLAVALLGLLLGVLAATGRRPRPLGVLTAGAAGVLALGLVGRLFLWRPHSGYTAVGAGGYVAVAAAVGVVAGAVLILRERARPPEGTTRPAAPAAPPAEPPGPRVRGRWLVLGAGALLAVYLATRLSFAARFPPFLDEALYASYADRAASSTRELFISFRIGQGPLLTWLAIPWIKVGLSPLAAVRMVSVASGLLTVVVVGRLAHELWGVAVGWVAAALCVAVPFFVVHDGIGVYEPLVTLEIAAALYLQLALARRPRLWVAVVLGLVLGLGLLTKQNALPAAALLPVSLLCFDWSPGGRGRRLAVWLAGVGVVALCLLGAVLVERGSRYYPDLQAARKSILLWPARPVTDVLDDPWRVSGLNWTTYRPALSGYVTVPLLALALAGVVPAWRSRPRATLVLLAWAVVPFAIALLFELRPFPRHVMYVLPPLLVLMALAVVRAAEHAARLRSRRLALLAVGAAGALALVPAAIVDRRALAHPATARYPGLDYWQYVAGWPAGAPWRDAADLIEHRDAGGRGPVLVPGHYGVLAVLLREQGRGLVVDRSATAPGARFGVMDSNRFPVDHGDFARRLARRGYVAVGRFRRPSACSGLRETACGGTVTVFERRG